jgi:hypothetical protein
MLTCTPEETATALIEEKYPVEQYENGIQKHREYRLQRFIAMDVPVAIIEKEKELIAYGKEVIALMKLMNKGKEA